MSKQQMSCGAKNVLFALNFSGQWGDQIDCERIFCISDGRNSKQMNMQSKIWYRRTSKAIDSTEDMKHSFLCCSQIANSNRESQFKQFAIKMRFEFNLIYWCIHSFHSSRRCYAYSSLSMQSNIIWKLIRSASCILHTDNSPSRDKWTLKRTENFKYFEESSENAQFPFYSQNNRLSNVTICESLK